ncbi:hypothetical protein BD560DRAFT_428457 [Blakeslea trispora]|nr:hypothetical protein BD560DRAFT_428457 [Blakeslea trispora]
MSSKRPVKLAEMEQDKGGLRVEAYLERATGSSESPNNISKYLSKKVSAFIAQINTWVWGAPKTMLTVDDHPGKKNTSLRPQLGIKLVFLIYALILRQTCVFKAGEKHKFKTSSLYISWQSFDPIRSFHQYVLYTIGLEWPLNTENVCLSFYIIGLLDIGCTRFPYATFPWVVKRLHIALTFAPIIWTSIRCSFISDNNSNRRSHSFVEIFKPSQSLIVEIEKLKDGTCWKKGLRLF